MSRRIDLHLHTNCSDGCASPAEVLGLVRARRLAAFAIADHDTLGGYFEVRDLIGQNDPELVPGLELSCSAGGPDLHVLAYLIDPQNAGLSDALAAYRENRNRRATLMVKKLNDMGVALDLEIVKQCAGAAPVGRPHFAQALLCTGVVSSVTEAFHRYIGDHAPAYVPKNNATPEEAIKLVHQAGGVAILAHPMINAAVTYLEALLPLGLDGIEVYHPDHKQSDVDSLRHLAARHRLLVTGGSDFHGFPDKQEQVGSEPVFEETLAELKAATLRRNKV